MPTNGYFGDVAPAAHSRRKSEMVTALAEMEAADEFFWSKIVDRISEGDFLSVVAQDLKVNHSILRNWIRGNKERESQFQQAEHDGRVARVAKVMKKTFDMALKENAAEPTHADQLRAAEIILKQESAATASQAPKSIGSITINYIGAKDGRPVEKVIGPD